MIKITLQAALAGVVLLTATGCGQDRIAALEKQNQELKAQMEKSHATSDYDLQAKCASDARAWFNENWSPSKYTLFSNFTNHYNKTMNKCFIVVEVHLNYSEGEWLNHVSLWDVYENSRYADFSEDHIRHLTPTFTVEERVDTCELGERKCASLNEFNDLTRPYMSN
ncbi:MAG TPA: hypothetical protein VKV15_15020 [Bryobacteraceae bacterium]|nr:hypothetical protein [Bryobacteraceae bacterium]